MSLVAWLKFLQLATRNPLIKTKLKMLYYAIMPIVKKGEKTFANQDIECGHVCTTTRDMCKWE